MRISTILAMLSMLMLAACASTGPGANFAPSDHAQYPMGQSPTAFPARLN